MSIFDLIKKWLSDDEDGAAMPQIRNGLGNFLVEKGLISENQLKEAIDYQVENRDKKIGEILTEINILGEDEVLEQLASYLNVKYTTLEDMTFPLNLQDMFDKRIMMQKTFVPFELSGNIICVAISDINNEMMKEEIKKDIEGNMVNYHVDFYLSFRGMIKDFIINSYDKHPHERDKLLSKKKKFGEYLIEKEIINQEQLKKVLEYQKEYIHKRFGELLYELKILNKETALKELAAHEGKEYESLEGIEPDKDLILLFDKDFMVENNFVPFYKDEKTIKIAMNNIFDDDLIEQITEQMKKRKLKVKFYISMRDSIRQFIEKCE